MGELDIIRFTILKDHFVMARKFVFGRFLYKMPEWVFGFIDSIKNNVKK